jgi:DNA-directed RNA polymerase subunit RPC12/RpoP
MPKIDERCPHPRCMETIEKYGEQYHGVFVSLDGTIKCENCGGKKIDGIWQWKCATCGRDVGTSERLHGLFVPHDCIECANKERESQRKRGAVCRRCRQVYYDCCC